MHVLWGLQQQHFDFELKGGTSLSKGYGIIQRFSEDIDILINPPPDAKVESNPKKTAKAQVESRRNFFDSLAGEIAIPGIQAVERDHEFDDEKFRSAGIRLYYDSKFDSIEGMKDWIILEVGFDRTHPNMAIDISSWAYDRATKDVSDVTNNRALSVKCYRPEYTFVEKIQTVIRKFRQYQETGELKKNFLRHYYDIYMLLDRPEVQSFIGTDEYLSHKNDRIRGLDKDFGIRPAFEILNSNFEKKYRDTSTLYYNGQPTLAEIMERVEPFIDKL